MSIATHIHHVYFTMNQQTWEIIWLSLVLGEFIRLRTQKSFMKIIVKARMKITKTPRMIINSIVSWKQQ